MCTTNISYFLACLFSLLVFFDEHVLHFKLVPIYCSFSLQLAFSCHTQESFSFLRKWGHFLHIFEKLSWLISLMEFIKYFVSWLLASTQKKKFLYINNVFGDIAEFTNTNTYKFFYIFYIHRHISSNYGCFVFPFQFFSFFPITQFTGLDAQLRVE